MRQFPGRLDQSDRAALTLIEVLVVMAIVGLLLAVLLPAVVQAREAARRATCRSHLKQFGIALHGYHGDHGSFPSHGAWGDLNGSAWSTHFRLLPYFGEGPMYERAVRESRPMIHYWIQYTIPAVYRCPSDGRTDLELKGSNFACNLGTGYQKSGFDGLFSKGESLVDCVRTAEVTDGLSNTAAMAEILGDDWQSLDQRRRVWFTPRALLAPDELDAFAELCRTMPLHAGAAMSDNRALHWYDRGQVEYNHILPPNARTCLNGTDETFQGLRRRNGSYNAASQHAGGAHVLLADGSVRFVGGIDLAIWRALGSRSGGDIVPEF